MASSVPICASRVHLASRIVASATITRQTPESRGFGLQAQVVSDAPGHDHTSVGPTSTAALIPFGA